MKNNKFKNIGAVGCITLFCAFVLIAPSFSGAFNNTIPYKNEAVDKNLIKKIFEPEIKGVEQTFDREYLLLEENVALAGEQNDIGYNADAGDKMLKAFPIYPGEPTDQTVPGRGRNGNLDPSQRDNEDWYIFSACAGQSIQASLTSSGDFSIEVIDTSGTSHAQSFTTDVTGFFFIRIFAESEADAAEYTFTISISGQNDAGTGTDAGDSIGQATMINAGSYTGYMDFEDNEDWYSFSATQGQGIIVDVEPYENSDYDVHLYDPTGNLVYSAQYYGEDTLEYLVDITGSWKIKIDMFPGWDTSKWPEDYFLYGSGVYDLKLDIGVSVESPPTQLPQPDITPIAQTFILSDNPDSNADEYGYIAAIPAANYMSQGKRHVSPIAYRGVDYIPAWFTTVDQTTQYLLDDWNTYLSRHDMVATEYNLMADPVSAAADIATKKWSSSPAAVVTVDGSDFNDNIVTVVNKETSLSSSPEIKSITVNDFRDIGGTSAYPMFLGNKWGAIHLIAKGDDFGGDTGIITPKYEGLMNDWWPYPYDNNGEDKDTFFPITTPGLWMPYVTVTSGLDELQIIKYRGDRYTIPIDTSACSIEATITTDTPSNLIVYLVDPEGNVRRPQIPHYNGGEIKPLHRWNGGHWEHDQDEFRIWKVEAHDDFSVDVHNAMEGKWTAIVVPYLDDNSQDVSFNGNYHIKIEVRKYNPKRIAAGLSAANGAVIASMNHIPLLYVKPDSIPPETSDAISQLGISNFIFVNIDDISSVSLTGTVTEYTTLQEVIDVIKADPTSENFITLVSFGTGDGYFAPAAMIAAYHTSPVLDIGQASEAYNTIDMIAAWREYAGDYYHGARSVGHLPQMDHPFDFREFIQGLLQGEFPPLGLDLKLRWFSAVYKGVHNLIDSYGLDLDGKEAYCFVSPRDTDIRDTACRAFEGNNSYAGHIPVETTAFSSAIIVRDILYPAIIYANPGRDVTTSQMMNFPDGYQWRANDGNDYPNFATREIKQIFSSHGRFYEGHCIWDNLLERYNTGASISYYSGHGTGGSGISAQYKNVAEQFPLAEVVHEHLKDFDWWDAWRGYSGYDNSKTKTVRESGASSYGSQEPNLYDIIHFKWADQLFGNLHSELEFWSSCTTGEHLGPIVYLSHGSALWFGAAGSTYGIQDDLHNSWMYYDALVLGESFGESHSKYTWIFNRDFTTLDPTTLYGRSTLFQLSEGGLTNVKALYGDPTMTCYAPNWVEPIPISS